MIMSDGRSTVIPVRLRGYLRLLDFEAGVIGGISISIWRCAYPEYHPFTSIDRTLIPNYLHQRACSESTG